jgi:predicted permease
MPVPPPRELKIGTIIDETLGVLERCRAPALAFVAVLTLLNGAAAYFGLDYTSFTHELAKGVFTFTVGVVGAYVLFEAMLRETGFLARGTEDSFLPYVGLSILYTLGVVFGLIVIILPGLFLMARWSVAQPLLITRGGGVMAAMRDSWERTRGNEFPILVAVIVLFGLLIAVSIFAGLSFEEDDPVGIVVSQLASSATSLIGIAMGVALYGLIVAGRSATKAGIDNRSPEA